MGGTKNHHGGGHGAWGPYQRGNRWVVLYRDPHGGPDGTGTRTSSRHETRAEADAEKRAFNAARDEARERGRTLTQAIEAYQLHLEGAGHKRPGETAARLRRFFAGDLNTPPSSLTARRCLALYDAAAARSATRWRFVKGERVQVALERPVAAATHRGELVDAKTFMRWCVARGWLKESPLAGVKGKGRKGHGKPQLHIDEARAWYEVAARLANAHAGAVAALATLVLGTRATELTLRQVRDLDDEGRLLWIPYGKTDAARRKVEVPEDLRPHLLRLAAEAVARREKDPAAPDLLFGTDGRGRPHGRAWPLFWVRKICDLAKVPRVSAHSMRGLSATLATEAGAISHLVSKALGHTSDKVTQAHYIAPGATKEATRRRGLTVLDGGKKKARR